jgi:DNA-binding FadR family transcriptional regulator
MTSYPGRGVHGQVVQFLGSQIVGGVIPVGSTLDVGALCEELDVSRTALRESFKVLAGKGLVDARQKRGTFVRPQAEWNLLDGDVIRWQVASGRGERLMRHLADVRSIVEPAAARRAAVHRTTVQLRALERALEVMGRTQHDSAAAAEADATFHRILLAATGNDILARMELLLEPGLRERDLLVHSHRDVADPVPRHRAVFDAIRDGDPERAELAMVRLLVESAADVDRLTSPQPAPGEDA